MLPMAETVPINEAKTRLSELLRRVEAGEEIIIRRGDTPIARLIPERRSKMTPPGRLSGRIWVADDFDDPLPEFVEFTPDR